MKCTTCGNDIPDGVKFCGVCGTSIGIAPSDSVVVDRPTDSVHGVAYDGEEPDELSMVEFIDAIKRGFQNYFKFSGRATRAEYWWFILFTQLISFVAIVPIIGWIIAPLVSLGSIIPSISLSVRRLHDIGKSGWWMMTLVGISFIWIIWIISLIDKLSGLENWGEGKSDAFWEEFLASFLVTGGILAIVGIAITIGWVVWFVRKGDKGPNKYGPDPRQVIVDNLDTT
jgi:uncharacterized membrane protein YhaH (DUF805 family)